LENVIGNPLAAFGPFHTPPHLIVLAVALLVGRVPACAVEETPIAPFVAFVTDVIRAIKPVGALAPSTYTLAKSPTTQPGLAVAGLVPSVGVNVVLPFQFPFVDV
jgi:hypothetical protein